MASYQREILHIVKRLENLGWRVTFNRHYRCYSPDPKIPPLTMAGTPSDAYALTNIKRDLKKRGVII